MTCEGAVVEKFITMVLLNLLLAAFGVMLMGEDALLMVMVASLVGTAVALVMTHVMGLGNGSIKDPLDLNNYPKGTKIEREDGRVFVKIPVVTLFMSDWRVIEINIKKASSSIREITLDAVEDMGEIIGRAGGRAVLAWIKTDGRVYHFAGMDVVALPVIEANRKAVLLNGLVYMEPARGQPLPGK